MGCSRQVSVQHAPALQALNDRPVEDLLVSRRSAPSLARSPPYRRNGPDGPGVMFISTATAGRKNWIVSNWNELTSIVMKVHLPRLARPRRTAACRCFRRRACVLSRLRREHPLHQFGRRRLAVGAGDRNVQRERLLVAQFQFANQRDVFRRRTPATMGLLRRHARADDGEDRTPYPRGQRLVAPSCTPGAPAHGGRRLAASCRSGSRCPRCPRPTTLRATATDDSSAAARAADSETDDEDVFVFEGLNIILPAPVSTAPPGTLHLIFKVLTATTEHRMHRM